MLPLSNIRVLDFTRHLPGPYATDLLVRLGAEVIKIEPPQGDPARWLPPFDGDFGTLYRLLNRGKKSVVVNLADAQGVAFVHKLAATCDVMVDTWRPGTAAKLSVDPATLQKINPRLVCCSISGYGQASRRSGHDANFAALAGLLDLQRDGEGHPVLPAVQLGDMGGAMYAALLILASLIEREQRGTGRILDISMLAAARSLMPTAEALHLQSSDPETTFFLTGSFPGYAVYRTRDHRDLMVAPLESHFWERFCRAIQREDLIPLQYDRDRREEVRSVIAGAIAERDLSQWEEVFSSIDACVEPALTVEESAQRFGDQESVHPIRTNFGSSSENLDEPGASFGSVLGDLALDDGERKSLRRAAAFRARKDLKRRLEQAVLRSRFRKP